MSRRDDLRNYFFAENAANEFGNTDFEIDLEGIDLSFFLNNDDSIDLLDETNYNHVNETGNDVGNELLDFDGIEYDPSNVDDTLHDSDIVDEAERIKQHGTGAVIDFSKVGDQSHDYNKHFKKHEFISEYRVSHNLRTRGDLFQYENEIDIFFHSMLLEYLNNDEYRRRNDLLSIEIFEPSMRNRIYVPPFRIQTFNVEDFLNTLMVLSQSNTEFLLSGTFQVLIRVVENVSGGSRKRKAPQEATERNHNKRSIVTIVTNQDNAASCGFRALYVGKYLADYGKRDATDWQRVTKDRRGKQSTGARELAEYCGFELTHRIEINDMQAIQEKLPNYQIRLIDAATREILFAGPVNEKEINIVHNDRGEGHYDHCSSINAFMERKYFCKYCNIGYDHRTSHSCEYTCEMCYQQPKCSGQSRTCSVCKRDFLGEGCYNRHFNNVCNRKKKCTTCSIDYTGSHKCNKHVCKKCNAEYVLFPHHCFLKPLDIQKLKDEDSVQKSYVFYDIETVQIRENNKITHKPNLLVCITLCDACYNYETKLKNNALCTQCGKSFIPFHGFDCVKNFCDYVYHDVAVCAARRNAIVLIFAHNAKGFDSHFILRDLFSRKFVQKPDIVTNGNQLLRIEIGNCRFIDSLCFFSMPLDALPKAFGLSAIKGHFPHEFNKEENFNYEGNLPPNDMYGVKFMTPKKARDLREWYEQECARLQDTGETFNFKRELEKYCIMDVMVLYQAIMEFSRLMKEITNIDPFTRNFTLASLAMEVFRAKFLKENTVGISPVHGYRDSKNASVVATAWIMAIEKMEQINNRDFKIYREQKFGNLYVDGVCHERKIIYEFYGCYWHGCNQCYENRMHEISRNGNTHAQNFAEIAKRNDYLSKFNYTVVSSSDCKLKEQLRCDAEFKNHFNFFKNRLEEIKEVGDINVEVRGGRTQNIYFYYKAQDDEEIKYYDFTSLYPFVCAKKRLPLGHPDIILPDTNDISPFYGYIKCAVIPPRKLHIPVLPSKVREKLMFPLCPVCAVERQQGSCEHTDDERTIIDTWYSEELKRAITKGYKIKKVYIVNNYKRSATNVFEDYVNTFLKLKQEASGFPAGIETEEQKQQYVNHYYEFTRISLDLIRICKNPALRTLAKLLLNTIWGKFAQQLVKAEVKLCTSYFEYWTVLNDPSKKIISEAQISDDVILVKYKEKEVDDCKIRKNNFPLAAAVTGNARDMLYGEIEKIENDRVGRVLYMDTDSLIFTKRDGEYEPHLGNFMGEMTDEVTGEYGPGSRIVEFVSNGPKNYGYRVLLANGESKYCLKVKGIRFNTETADMITFQRMVEVAVAYMNGRKLETRVPQFSIGTDLYQNVFSNYFDKVYRAVTDKRRVINNDTMTRPYGYVD